MWGNLFKKMPVDQCWLYSYLVSEWGSIGSCNRCPIVDTGWRLRDCRIVFAKSPFITYVSVTRFYVEENPFVQYLHRTHFYYLFCEIIHSKTRSKFLATLCSTWTLPRVTEYQGNLSLDLKGWLYRLVSIFEVTECHP